MKSVYEKEDYTIEDIQSLITNEVEESIYIDFKEASALDKSDKKKLDISKDVSSFANSDGGLIIYGLREENHKAHSFSFLDGNTYTKEWLEQVISSSIQRRIPDIKIFPLRMNGDIAQTVYVVKIPRSIETPHLAKDKKFYKRFNFESVPMEEYEIRQLYGRKLKSKLVIQSWLVRPTVDSTSEEMKYIFEASAMNVGDVVESDYKTNVYFKNFTKDFDFSWGTHQTNNDYTVLEERIKISAVGTVPIFPTETVNSIRFNFTVPKNRAKELLDKVEIEIRLFYSDGEDQFTSDLKHLSADKSKVD